MAWTKPKFGRGQVDQAGKQIVGLLSGDLKWMFDESHPQAKALSVVDNWRASHRYLLFLAHSNLSKQAIRVDPNALTADRIKRLASIEAKLRVQPTMQLSRIQDIGGCRAILTSIDQVDALHRAYLQRTWPCWELAHEDPYKYDYIAKPKGSGYRSLHLVYKYRSRATKHEAFNGQRIEIQIRSRLQHAWATANEIAEMFTGLQLKAYKPTVAPQDIELFAKWKRFFVLASGIIANLEARPPVPNVPQSITDLRRDLQDVDNTLNAYRSLQTWRTFVKVQLPQIVEPRGRFLITVEKSPEAPYAITVRPFVEDQDFTAFREYALAELALNNAVLVTIHSESLNALQEAYPNYYADATSFLETIRPFLLTAL
jgi:hypothetical protein